MRATTVHGRLIRTGPSMMNVECRPKRVRAQAAFKTQPKMRFHLRAKMFRRANVTSRVSTPPYRLPECKWSIRTGRFCSGPRSLESKSGWRERSSVRIISLSHRAERRLEMGSRFRLRGPPLPGTTSNNSPANRLPAKWRSTVARPALPSRFAKCPRRGLNRSICRASICRISGRMSQRVLTIHEEFGGASRLAGDHRLATGHALDDHHPERFRLGAGMYDRHQVNAWLRHHLQETR